MSRKIFKAVSKVASVVASVAAFIPIVGTVVALGASAIALGSSLLAGKPKAPQTSPADRERLFASIDVRTPRKMAFGYGAMNTDIRDEEYAGNEKEYFHRFVVCAAHKVGSIQEIWFDDKLAWTVGGGVQGEFAGYLAVTPILEGSAANAINISPRMGNTRRYTGCAYVHFRYKLTGNNKNSDSPFSQSVPTRMTIVGAGMPIYDPRKDETRGGVGGHRIDDQSTWDWVETTYRNPALQTLAYLIGWKINGRVSVGKGIPPNRINIDSFAVAANACDETVSLSAGGTEPRYRTDGVFSERDPMPLVLNQFKSSMNATLDDVDGQLRIYVLHNDLALPIVDFDENDIIGEVDWKPQLKLTDQFNIIRGSHTDPSNNSLYQSVSYPELELTSEDGIDRIETIDYPLVQSSTQCQRLAKQRLQRMQYSGIFTATYQAKAWKAQKGDVVRQKFAPLGFANKLFRVIDSGAQFDGLVPMVLREEHADLYLWDSEEQASVVAAAPDTYDYTKNPLYQDIAGVPNFFPIMNGPSIQEINDALKDVVYWQEGTPSTANSSIGQKWVKPSTGEIFIRVGGGILLDGKVITLGGFRPSIYWTLQADQPLRDALQTTSQAYVNANDAIDRLDGLADDGRLSINEKITKLIPDTARFDEKYAVLIAQASAFSVDTTDVVAKKSAWDSFLGSLSPAWNDTSADTAVTRNSFDTNRDALDKALYDLDEAIKSKAATQANWSGVADDDGNKPEDRATRNKARGNYAAGTAYDPGDSVVWTVASGGTGHNYTRIGTGATTGVSPSDGTKWVLSVERGEAGGSGLNSAVVFIYQRKATVPSLPSVTATYTFASGQTTGLDNGWSSNIPSGSDPLYVATASGSSTGASDTIASNEWAPPEILAQDGNDGSPGTPGTPGLTSAVAFIYQRKATVPSLPSVTATYTFASGQTTGLDNGWSSNIPSGSDPLYVSTAGAASSGASDTITAGEWAVPSILAQDGNDGLPGTPGTPGAAGLNSAVAFIYQRKATVPSLPSVTATYTFASGQTAGLDNGWSSTVPAGSDPLYVSTAGASSTGASDTIASNEWAPPEILAQDGNDGSPGTPGTPGDHGLNAATVYLYRRSTSSPTRPSVTSTYTFASGVLAGHNNGWFQSVPDGTDPIYVITAAAVGTGSTDTIGAGEWSTANIIAKNGINGIDGVGVEFVFQRSINQPGIPTGNGIPSGWFDDIPDGDFPLWESNSKQEPDGTLIGSWSSPIRKSENDQLLIVADLAAADALNPKVGQRAMVQDGTIYQRVSSTGILLGGKVITLGGFRPSLKWTKTVDQPVLDARNAGARLGFNLWDANGDNRLTKEEIDNAYVQWGAILGAEKPDDFADISKEIDGIASTYTFKFNFDGSAKTAQFPKDIYSKLVLGNGTDVTALTTWSVSLVSGNAGIEADHGGTKGKVRLSSLMADSVVRITASYSGVTRNKELSFLRQEDQAPQSGAGGGGGSDSDATITDSASTSYPADSAANAGPIVITASSSGKIRITLPLSYTRTTSTSGDTSATAKLRYRAVGGSYADTGSAVTGSDASTIDLSEFGQGIQQLSGSLSIDHTLTGLTSGQEYEFIGLIKNDNTATLVHTGNFAGVALES